MFRIKTNGCRRRNAKGCGFLGGGVALGETERWGRVSQTIKNEITIVSYFQGFCRKALTVVHHLNR